MNLNDRPTPETDELQRRLILHEFDPSAFPFAVVLEKMRNLERQRDAATAALQKINVIRNSIIAHQSCNFSEHVYPLVAALDEAGIEGMTYPDALAYYGPMTERAVKAEKQRDAAVAALENCESMMRQASAMVLERVRGAGDVFWERALDEARATLAAIKGAL